MQKEGKEAPQQPRSFHPYELFAKMQNFRKFEFVAKAQFLKRTVNVK